LGAAFAYSGSVIDGGDPLRGHQIAAATSVVLAGAMASRYLKTQKMMPAGMLAAVGALSSAYHVKKVLEWS
jgi:uncharacterized membrane protein (UPF0136 family)